MIRKIRRTCGQLEQRNYLLGILHGIFVQTGMNLTNPGMVLAVFVRALGGSNALVGLLSAIRFGGWLLPQFLVAGWIQSKPRKVPVVIAMEMVRILVYGGLGGLTYVLGSSHSRLLILLFFVLFTSSRFTAGTGALARLDIVGQCISPARRASFFALRDFFGGACVFGIGFLVQYLLDAALGPPFPNNFTALFALSSGCFILAAVAFSQIRESPDASRGSQPSLKEQLMRVPALLRQDPIFKRYLLARILLNLTIVIGPFYAVLALDVLGAPESMVGFYLSAMTLAAISSNLFWQAVDRRRGTPFIVRAASLLTVLTPLLAATLPWLMGLAGFTIERYGLLPAYVFTIVFVVAGIGNSGRGIGFISLLLHIAPDEERAHYIGLVNTSLGFVTLLSILSGAVIDWVGFEPVFFMATGLLLLGYLVMSKLDLKQVSFQ